MYGADAVYCGVPRFSLRARENEFTMETLAQSVQTAREWEKKIYFTTSKWDAHLVVFLTDIQSDARWLNTGKSHLL